MRVTALECGEQARPGHMEDREAHAEYGEHEISHTRPLRDSVFLK